jgi:hypothetical protein
MEAVNIIPAKIEVARECCHLGEYEDALVQYETALVLLKDLVNEIPAEATEVRYVRAYGSAFGAAERQSASIRRRRWTKYEGCVEKARRLVDGSLFA